MPRTPNCPTEALLVRLKETACAEFAPITEERETSTLFVDTLYQK